MIKKLDLNTELVDFENQKLIVNGQNITLKNVLLTYCSSAHMMGLKNDELGSVFDIGVKIGTSNDGVLKLSREEWTLLKKLCDNPQVQQGQNKSPIFGVVITQQVSRIVDGAVTE